MRRNRWYMPFMAATAAVAGLSAPLAARAEIGIYAKGGTLGLGGGIGIGITDTLNARIGYTAINVDHDISDTDVDYKGQFKLGGGELLLDWHPFASSFRVTAGAIINRNKIDVKAKLDRTVVIDDVQYDAGDLGDLSGDVKFNSVSPYLGIGWGNVVGKEGNLHFVADIGVQYLGTPDVNLHASCSAQGVITDPVACAQLDDNVRREEHDLNDEVSDYKWWPVLSLGVAYRF